MKTINRMVFLVLIIMLYVSCQLTNMLPPWVTGKPVLLSGEHPAQFLFSGIEFDFLNTASKEIVTLDIACLLIDPDSGKSALSGQGLIHSRYNGSIAGGELKTLVISLDEWIYCALPPDTRIEFFHFPKITYCDGSTWEDPFGCFHTDSNTGEQ